MSAVLQRLPVTLNQRANLNQSRYEYLRMRGHSDYCDQVLINESMYLGESKGQGGQWRVDDKAALRVAGRMPVELNEIRPLINTAIGYQIANRMDISFRPRGHGADDATADTLSKVAMQVADQNKLHWIETGVFSDGLIDQRGYFDIRMCYDDNIGGDIEICQLDPCDVIPDPDANEYDNSCWADVTLTRWPTADTIEQYYGVEAREKVENYGSDVNDYSGWSEERRRMRFGNSLTGDQWYDSYKEDVDTTRYRVIDRQYFVYERCNVIVYVNTGDVKVIDGLDPEEVDRLLSTPGAVKSKRMARRVKWLITCGNVVLYDDYSPWPFFTVVPYFPYFRKGRTRGMVDGAIWPQNLVNKGLSTGIAIFNHMAKGTWQGEVSNLDGMTADQFKDEVSKPGAFIPLKDGAKKFTQEQGPQMPSAVSEFIKIGLDAMRSTTGVSAELDAVNTEDMSGVAIQARQYAAQQKLAVPLDNLARTRHMLAERMLWFIQHYYTGPRIFRITEKDEFGRNATKEIAVNQEQDDGSVLNDLTVGTYDVIISEQPIAITFDNTQYQQLKEMKKDMEYPIPIEWMVRYSNVSDKSELIEAVQAAQQAQSQAPPDPISQAEIAVKNADAALKEAQQKLVDAQTQKAQNDATQSGVTAIYSATQAAGEVAALPQIAGIADNILGSAGFIDRDRPPIISLPGAPAVGIDEGAGLAQAAPPTATVPPQPFRSNTDPLTPPGPPSPRIGADRGIEKPGIQLP
jgi:hypothetical protein